MGRIVPVPPGIHTGILTKKMQFYELEIGRPIASILVQPKSPVPEPYYTRWRALLNLAYSDKLLPSCYNCSWRNQMCHTNQGVMRKCRILELTHQPELQNGKRVSLGLPPLEHRGVIKVDTGRV